jgi:hypothetical protein
MGEVRWGDLIGLVDTSSGLSPHLYILTSILLFTLIIKIIFFSPIAYTMTMEIAYQIPL